VLVQATKISKESRQKSNLIPASLQDQLDPGAAAGRAAEATTHHHVNDAIPARVAAACIRGAQG